MGLNSRLGMFHPDFAYHVRPTVNSAQLAKVKVYKPTGVRATWTPGDGMSDDSYELVWQGQGRIQPDLDWRARNRDFSGEQTGVIAVRVQLPIGGNELGDDVTFAANYRVNIEYMPNSGGNTMVGKTLYVRNATMSSNAWLYNLLCDSDTGKHA